MSKSKKIDNKCRLISVAHHKEQGSHEQHTLFDVWTGDVSSALQTAADKGQLNDWLMALAPSGESS